MRDRWLIEKFMECKKIEYNEPFIVKWGKGKEVVVSFSDSHYIYISGISYIDIIKIEGFNEETPWGNYDTLDYKKFIFDIVFNEGIEIVKVPWKPKLEDTFYYIDADNGDVLKKEFDIEDKAYFLIGNCFKTEAEAQANKWKVVQILHREKPLINLNEW